MGFINLLFLFVFVTVAYSANPLACYFCDGQLNKSCFDPFDPEKVPLKNCSDLHYSHTENYRMGTLDSTKARAAADTQFECFVVEKKFAGNYSEIVRSCKIIDSKDFCQAVIENSAHQHYNVSKCRTCEENKCNSAGMFHVSLFLTVYGICTAFLY